MSETSNLDELNNVPESSEFDEVETKPTATAENTSTDLEGNETEEDGLNNAEDSLIPEKSDNDSVIEDSNQMEIIDDNIDDEEFKESDVVENKSIYIDDSKEKFQSDSSEEKDIEHTSNELPNDDISLDQKNAATEPHTPQKSNESDSSEVIDLASDKPTSIDIVTDEEDETKVNIAQVVENDTDLATNNEESSDNNIQNADINDKLEDSNILSKETMDSEAQSSLNEIPSVSDIPPQLPARRLSQNLNTADLTKVAPAPTSPPLPPRETPQETVHSVPPSLLSEMKNMTFRKNLALSHAAVSPPNLPARNHSNHSRVISSAAEINLIADRLRKTSNNFQNENDITKENLKEGRNLLKSSYTTLVERLVSTSITTNSESSTTENEPISANQQPISDIDWNFWSMVVNDFSKVTNEEPDKLEQKIADGIPSEIRGIIWQLMANSKSKEYDEIYSSLANIESTHEASIRRDIKRTNFIPDYQTEALFNVMKTYSLYDGDVGYTQGMAFIVAPLLLNCDTEADAFGLLISLMKNYGLRELFLPNMPGLMLMLYQFDRLIEENSPQLYNYLARQGIRSTMYATQWFLTFFAYRFPLGFVIRVFDIVFVEGIEAILKFAVILMLRNEGYILSLKFDQLLDFLKTRLFYYYSNDSIKEREANLEASTSDQEESNLFKDSSTDIDSSIQQSVVKMELTKTYSSQSTILRKFDTSIQDSEYNIDLFVHDAMNEIHITPISLQRYADEYADIHELEQQKEQQYEHLRIKNHQLHREVKKLEHDYTQLNREHVSIANELIKNRLSIETLLDENSDLKMTILDLKRQLEEEIRKQSLPNPDAALPNDLKHDLEQAMNRNAEVMTENMRLQDKIGDLENYVERLKEIPRRVASANSSPSKAEPTSPQAGGWTGFKKVFAKPT